MRLGGLVMKPLDSAAIEGLIACAGAPSAATSPFVADVPMLKAVELTTTLADG